MQPLQLQNISTLPVLVLDSSSRPEWTRETEAKIEQESQTRAAVVSSTLGTEQSQHCSCCSCKTSALPILVLKSSSRLEWTREVKAGNEQDAQAKAAVVSSMLDIVQPQLCSH